LGARKKVKLEDGDGGGEGGNI